LKNKKKKDNLLLERLLHNYKYLLFLLRFLAINMAGLHANLLVRYLKFNLSHKIQKFLARNFSEAKKLN